MPKIDDSSEQATRQFSIAVIALLLPPHAGVHELLVYAGLVETYVKSGGFPVERENVAG